MKKALRQWHLPLQNALQITLERDEGHYELCPERELVRKPLRMDMLILKREEVYEMKSSFGRLLRKHTILEYKGYGDYLSIDDFYKGLSYTFLYKSEGVIGGKHHINQIPVEDISLIFLYVIHSPADC